MPLAHSQARFAFERALEVWEGAPDARQGLVDASRLLLEYALATEDLPLAERLLPECGETSPLAARVEALRARLAARDREPKGGSHVGLESEALRASPGLHEGSHCRRFPHLPLIPDPPTRLQAPPGQAK